MPLGCVLVSPCCRFRGVLALAGCDSSASFRVSLVESLPVSFLPAGGMSFSVVRAFRFSLLPFSLQGKEGGTHIGWASLRLLRSDGVPAFVSLTPGLSRSHTFVFPSVFAMSCAAPFHCSPCSPPAYVCWGSNILPYMRSRCSLDIFFPLHLYRPSESI